MESVVANMITYCHASRIGLKIALTFFLAGLPCVIAASATAETPTMTTNEARLASSNGIVLHFGDDISERNENVIVGGLGLAGYKVQSFRGGPVGHIALCINERCGDRNFSVDAAHRFLISVLDDVVPEYRNE